MPLAGRAPADFGPVLAHRSPAVSGDVWSQLEVQLRVRGVASPLVIRAPWLFFEDGLFVTVG